MPTEYSLAVCIGEKDGSNSVYIQQAQKAIDHSTWIHYPCTAKGVKLHGETIFGATMFTLMNGAVQFLVTASEDCTTRLSAWSDGHILDSVMLDPQPSCVRCVSASQVDDSSVLLAVGGGKLMIQFFVVRAVHDQPIRSGTRKRYELPSESPAITRCPRASASMAIAFTALNLWSI